MCTFWLVEALTKAGRVDRPRLDQARLIFEKMLGYANHLGLFAEETGVHGEALGNFPQGFTHLALDQLRLPPGPGAGPEQLVRGNRRANGRGRPSRQGGVYPGPALPT